MHYHAGLYENPQLEPPDDAIADRAARRAVTELYRFIPEGSRVYDVGCGWGGTLACLIKDLRCRSLGVTVSKSQFRHCADAGLPVRYADAERTLPPGLFDCVLMLESLSHIRDKKRLLQVLRRFTQRLVIRVNCQDGAPPGVRFGGTMHMISSSQLRAMLEETGWQITHWVDRREEAMPSLYAWSRRLEDIGRTDDVHLETLRTYCRRVLRFPRDWAANNPLIELAAK